MPDLGNYTAEDRGHDSPCWIWQGAKNNHGYGTVGGSNTEGRGYVHRLLFVRHRGQIPADTELDHLCRNRSCVNPAHLDPVDHKTNCRRGAKAKITADDAERIRSLRGEGFSTRYVAGLFGLHPSTISRIANGHRWA